MKSFGWDTTDAFTQHDAQADLCGSRLGKGLVLSQKSTHQIIKHNETIRKNVPLFFIS
jgi:hypothetical protein